MARTRASKKTKELPGATSSGPPRPTVGTTPAVLPSPLPALASLSALLDSFPARHVLVLGDLVADEYLYGQTDRVSREAPVLVVRHESSEVKLGGAANAAANARALGAEVTVVGALGEDAMGAELRRLFESAGIGLRAANAPATETKTRILAGGINTTRQQMLRVDRGNVPPLPAAAAAQLVEHLRAAAAEADIILVSDYGLGVACEPVRAELHRLAERTRVCVDSRSGLHSLAGFHTAKPNEPELQALTGVPVASDDALLRAGGEALELLECQSVLVTRGRKGMALFEKSGPTSIPVHGARDAVDVTGAGDTVMAAFSLALAAGATALQAALLANVAGALVVQKQGTATVPLPELRAELERG
jgi:rfaE bifunctional protein kinase chain/domain